MLNNFTQSVGCTNGVRCWNSGFTGLAKVLGGILVLAVCSLPDRALCATVPSPSVTLNWDRSASSEVTGYRIYYGAASGNYTNSILVGNLTSNTVPGLTVGGAYFFAVVAFNASGLESVFSNEIGYTVPNGIPTVKISMAANRQVNLTLTGLSGHTYEVQASQNFTTWAVLGTVTLGMSGTIQFADTTAASFPRRFYRTHDTQP